MKLILAILSIFLLTKADAQKYVASWTGWGHTRYMIQSSLDSINWKTIDSVSGTIGKAKYTYNIRSNNYYYRVKAEKDSTNALYTPELLAISTDSIFGAPDANITALEIYVHVEDRLHYVIKSPQAQEMTYSLYDIEGRKISECKINLFKGVNDFYDFRPGAAGIYYAQFVGYFNEVTLKILNF